MGYNLQWLAVKNKDEKNILKTIELKSTRQYEELPEADFNATKINDWYLISNNCREVYELFTDAMIKKLSKNCQVIKVDVCESTMFSIAECWEDGKSIWSILHNSEYGTGHLNIEGNPPKILDDIVNQCKKKQSEERDADYIYEIPIELANELVGYRHDEDIEQDEAQWVILVPDDKPNRIKYMLQSLGTCYLVFYLIRYRYTKWIS
jgi:hypothetical protein